MGTINEILGHQGLRFVSKIILLIAGLGLFSFAPEFIVELFDIAIFDLDLITVGNIIGALLWTIAWLIHSNQL
tara:strand:- start:199 stop:417 length:219 start_codon:yes stop_codon:yes gene_type:complete